MCLVAGPDSLCCSNVLSFRPSVYRNNLTTSNCRESSKLSCEARTSGPTTVMKSHRRYYSCSRWIQYHLQNEAVLETPPCCAFDPNWVTPFFASLSLTSPLLVSFGRDFGVSPVQFRWLFSLRVCILNHRCYLLLQTIEQHKCIGKYWILGHVPYLGRWNQLKMMLWWKPMRRLKTFKYNFP